MSLVFNIAYRKKKKVEPVADIDYLYFTSAEPFSVTLSGQSGKIWNQIEYSKDKVQWSILDHAQTVSGAANETIYYRGTNNSSISKNTSGDWNQSNRFSFTGTSIECGGNIETLLDYEKVSQNIHPTMSDGCFIMLFADCTALISAPKLSALILSKECYGGMFARCTSLILPPALPATSLANNCYYQMFDGCTSLQAIPELPATEIASQAYHRILADCSEYLFATRPVEDCSVPVTSHVTSSSSQGAYAFYYNGTQYDYPTTTFYTHALIKTDGTLVTSAEYPVAWMYFISEQDLQLAINAISTTISDNLYYSLNNGKSWTAWRANTVTVPSNTRFYVNGTDIDHFATGTSLNQFSYIKEYTDSEFECYGNIEALLDWETVHSGVEPTMANYAFACFFESTKITTAPDLPAITTLTDYCYDGMFNHCTCLEKAPDLPAEYVPSAAYYEMFLHCSSLVISPRILAKQVGTFGCGDMFKDCSSLQLPPALPASSVGYDGYTGMFNGCVSLISIPALPARVLNRACYQTMFQGCTSLSIVQRVDTNHEIPYTIPYQKTLSGSVGQNALDRMFQFNESAPSSTTDTPATETTYYVYSVIEPDGTILTTKPTHIYGASWDGTNTTKWTRTDEAADFADPVPYVSGATEYGSPFDDLYPWKDMTIVEDDDAGTMVKIPKFWYKLTQTGAGMSIQIADKAVDGYSVCPACMDRGDGNGERDYILIGRYHCANSTYKSKTSELPAVNATRADFRTGIQALGTGIYMADWATRFTLFLLYLVEFADWNSQNVIGYGCGNDSSTENMGYTDSMPYHTGTTQSSRTTYGLGTQYRNIEGLWDNVYDWIDGCYNSSAGLSIILDPTKFSDSANGISVGSPWHGYPSAFSVTTIDNTFPLFMPSATRGSTSTYSCDGWFVDSSCPCICVGGFCHQTAYVGLFCFNFGIISGTSEDIGSRPMKLPNFTNN